MEHAQAFEPIQDGRIYIEKINGPFLFGDKATPAEYSAGLELAMARGWLELHEIRNPREGRRRAVRVKQRAIFIRSPPTKRPSSRSFG